MTEMVSTNMMTAMMSVLTRYGMPSSSVSMEPPVAKATAVAMHSVRLNTSSNSGHMNLAALP